MRALSIVVVIGVAFAIPAPHQSFNHGPITREVLNLRGTNWDGVVGEELPIKDGDHESQIIDKFRIRANDLIDSMLKQKKSVSSRRADAPSSQDPYGTGLRLDKNTFVTLRDAKLASRIQSAGTPTKGGGLKREAKPPARFETSGLQPHDGRGVDEQASPISHVGRRGWKDLPTIIQDDSVEGSLGKGQQKKWNKGRGGDWSNIPVSDDVFSKRQQDPTDNISWGRQAYGIDSAESETDSVRITRRVPRES